MYDYLRKFINPQGRVIEIWHENVFISINKKAIEEAEERLGYKFPEQLREFYQEIGYGHLTTPYNAAFDYKFYNSNEIMRPSEIADILLLGHDSGLISEGTLEFLEPGDMPFFHIGDSCLFLVMKVNSENPNAVYNQWGDLIEENFNKFIWRLYYEIPTYYENVLPVIEETPPLDDEAFWEQERTFSIDRFLKLWSTNREAAKGYFIQMLNRKDQFEIFKTHIGEIPHEILEDLIDMILSRSSFHKEQCEEIKEMMKKAKLH